MGIICLEGPDCTGKSTLARHFETNYGATCFHATYRFKKLMPAYQEALRRKAARVSNLGKLAILDRHWLTESVYARVFRGGTEWPQFTRDADRIFLETGILTVLCLPNTIKESIKRKFERVDQADLDREKPVNGGKSYDRRQVVELYSRYLDLWNGSMFCDGDDRAAELTRTGGVRDRPDFMRYRIEVEGQDAAAFARGVLKRLKQLNAKEKKEKDRDQREAGHRAAADRG